MIAIRTARNAAIGLEIRQLETAIEAYRLEKGDYPPNFRHPEVVRRHITKCYPRINQAYFTAFMNRVFPPNGSTIPTPATSNAAGTVAIDEAESLVFWLSMTDTNQQYPFLSFMPWPQTQGATPYEVNPKRYYDFEESRLKASPVLPATGGQAIVNALSSFEARFCNQTAYLYLDSRSYDKPQTEAWDLGRFQGADGSETMAYSRYTNTGVRPYWSTTKNPNQLANVNDWRDDYKPVNATTFQIISAGQDGDFGFLTSDTLPKIFNTGDNYTPGDKDNLTNFSGGRTLNDNVP
jgi:hypothetical protein